MVRLKKHNGVDYIIIDTDLVIYEEGQPKSKVPAQVQIRVKDLSEKNYKAVYRHACMYFDRIFVVDKPLPKKNKSWFNKLFN